MADTPQAGVGERDPSGAGGALPVLPPRFALIELAVFGLIIIAELTWDAFPDFTRLNPHPYWVPVLLLSLQYGTVSGLLAAAMAIGGVWLIGIGDQDIGESYFAYMIRIWTQPVLWIVAALLIGAFRVRQIEQRDDLLKKVADATEQASVLHQHVGDLQTRCDDLERQIAARPEAETDRLLEMLALAGRADRDDARRLAREALGLAWPGAQVSISAVTADGAEVVETIGWPERARWRRQWTSADPMLRAVVAERRQLSVLSAADEAILAGDAMLAVPILGAAGDAVVGMLKVEASPPSALGPGSLDRLAAIARHLGPAVGSATFAENSTQAAPRPVLLRHRLTDVLLGRRVSRDAAE